MFDKLSHGRYRGEPLEHWQQFHLRCDVAIYVVVGFQEAKWLTEGDVSDTVRRKVLHEPRDVHRSKSITGGQILC